MSATTSCAIARSTQYPVLSMAFALKQELGTDRDGASRRRAITASRTRSVELRSWERAALLVQ